MNRRAFVAGSVAFNHRQAVELGGLIGYGASIPALTRRSATYIDKIFKGASPAKTLGLTIPPSLLARADQVIE